RESVTMQYNAAAEISSHQLMRFLWSAALPAPRFRKDRRRALGEHFDMYCVNSVGAHGEPASHRTVVASLEDHFDASGRKVRHEDFAQHVSGDYVARWQQERRIAHDKNECGSIRLSRASGARVH